MPLVLLQSFHGFTPRQDGDIDAGFSETHQVSGPAAKPIITTANEEVASQPGDVVPELVGGCCTPAPAPNSEPQH